MEIVTRTKCVEIDCNIQPSFNFSSETKPIYCKTHSKNGMQDIKKKTCLESDCDIKPCFNFPSETKPIYCKTHSKNGMQDITKKKCLEQDCDKRPNFNFSSETKPIYCKTHSKNGMQYITKKKCLEPNCNTLPCFNFPSEIKPIYCKTHSKNGMQDITKKKCLEQDCDKRPNFNFSSETKPIYCKTHSKNGMQDITNKKCKTGCGTRSIIKYKGYCFRCFIFTFPNENISKNYKVKEQHITDFIKENYKDFTFDKIIDQGCSKRRPDAYLDLLTHIIIIECDETQHKTYEDICENKRTMEISNDFNFRPIIFIRFNPDAYTKNDKKVLSSFKIHKSNGIAIIRDKIEWNNRLSELKKLIDYYLNFIPEKTITNEYLFFDSE